MPSIVFSSENATLLSMTIEQKKISLINWITLLEDEAILDQIVEFKKPSLDELPDSIVQVLKIAQDEPDENLVKHTSAKDFLNIK